MNVLVVTGIWPPDVGGPASHAPEVATYLLSQGHAVTVLTTAGEPPAAAAFPIHWVSRRSPPGVRHAEAIRLIATHARRSDVVYSTGMMTRSWLGSRLAQTPYVLKLTSDPAFERARRRLHWTGSLEAFQAHPPRLATPLRGLRNRAVTSAAHIVTPSAFLGELAHGWGAAPDGVTVLPNPAPSALGPPREEVRADFGFAEPTFVFAGRLTEQKGLVLGVEACRRAGAALVVAGDGPERRRIEGQGYARMLGPLPRERVLDLFRAADAALLPSVWENFPHSVVEALAVGTPVISTRVGGVAEVVVDGVNGLLVEPGDVAALAAAIRRFVDEPELAAELRRNAAASVEAFSADRIYGALEEVLAQASRRRDPG